LFLLFPFGVCLAENEAGKVDRGPVTPAALPDSFSGELSFPVETAAQVRWRRDAVIPKLGEILPAKVLDGYLGSLGEVKEILAQSRADQKKEAPKAMPQGQAEGIKLTLEQSVEIALKNNLGVRITELTKDAQAQEVFRAKAKFHPTIGLTVTGSGEDSLRRGDTVSDGNNQNVTAFIKQEVPTGATLTLSTDLKHSETHTSGSDTDSSGSVTEFASGLTVNIVQPVLRGGRVFVATRPIRDAEFDLRAAEARLRAEVLRVTAAAKSAYYNMVLTEKVVEVTEGAIQRDKTLIEATQALFKAGFVTKLDVFSAELVLAQDSARLVSNQANLESAKNVLLDVLGLPISTQVALLDKTIPFRLVLLELEKWIAAALTNRPEIYEVGQQLAKSSLNVRNARNNVLPQVDLVASYGRSHLGPTLGRALDLNGRVWTAGLVFSIPIGNVAPRSALARAGIEHNRLEEILRQTRRTIELEVRAAVIKLRESLETMKALQIAIEQAKGRLEVAQARFSLGHASNLDIVLAQKDLLDAETQVLSATVNYNIGLAELEARIAETL
jgi:outer membrane protein TolC